MKPKQDLTKKVIKNALYQGLSGIIAKLGALIFTIVVARMLFPELFGLYSLALTIILTIITISDLGFSQTIIRYIADSLGKRKRKQARSRFLFLLKFKFFIALIFAILLFLFSGLLANLFSKPGLVLPLQVGSIYLFITSIYMAFNTLFFALQKIKYNTIAESIFQVSRIALIFIFLYFYKAVTSVFIALSISLFFALIFLSIIINKKYNFLIRGKQEPVKKRRLLIFSAFIALTSLSAIIFADIDKLMLGYFLEAEFIGYYTAIFSVISGFLGLLGLSIVVFPVFTQIHGKRLKRAFKKTFHYLVIIAFPITLGLAYLFVPVLQILYGQAYVPFEYKITLTVTSIFLSFIILEGIITGLYAILFNAKEKPKLPAVTMIIVAILNIILNFILISYFIKFRPEYGLIGASMATFISRYIFLGTLIILAKTKLKISPNKSSIIKPLIASIVMLAFLFIFDYFIPLNIFLGIIMVISAALVYILVMFLIRGIKKEDFKLIRLIKS